MELLHFGEPYAAFGLIAVPLLLAFGIWGYQKSWEALHQRFSPVLLEKLLTKRPRPVLRFALPLGFLLLALLALMRPQGEPELAKGSKKGQDLVVLLDLSRSMFAEDLKPNRLFRAKEMVSDLIGALKGERIAIITFSGDVKLICPLTLDYNYARNALEQAEPQDLRQGGTQTGLALQEAIGMLFYDVTQKNRQILLITDGENHQSNPLEVVQFAQEKGVVIHTLGIGDPAGATIPTENGPLTYEGKTVVTRLDEASLKQIAQTTGGYYLPVQTKQVDMGMVYQKILSQTKTQPGKDEEVYLWQEWFLWFLWPAALLLLFSPGGALKTPLHGRVKKGS